MSIEKREQAEFHGDVQWLDRFHNIFINLLEARRERNAFAWYNELINLYLEVISVMTQEEDKDSYIMLEELKDHVNKWIDDVNNLEEGIQPDLLNKLLKWERMLRVAFKKTGLQFKAKDDLLEPENF